MVLFALASLAGHWLYRHRQYVPDLLTYLPWLLGMVLIMKLAVAAWTARTLKRLNLVTTATVRNALFIWLALCVGVVAVVGCFLPLTPTIAIGIAMSVPVARIAAAPLCLHWNRHR
jgi:hypothetical protein